EHIHPLQEERFQVIAGTLRGRVAGKELTSGPGENVVVPKGTPHVWWNSGDDELHVLVEVRPALRFENFFETFFGLAQDGKVNAKTGLPNPFQLALMMRTFRNELVLAQPPRLVQTLLFGSLAPIGRLLGYKGEHPYPDSRRAQAT
ncbi:MAG TPA: cupin domain-containing protein, partial [Caldilineaceae bacterium]|nr:cupin domain-containing protein [Caldilineaceae bacterium]